jgi:parallel beta-helix repeat protein
VRNAGSSIEDSGIKLSGAENCSINGNVLIENGNNGIMLYQSIDNAVIANIVEETGQSGIILYGSNNNTVSENTVQNPSEYGIALQNSYYCHVTGNTVTRAYEGIALLASNGNSVCRNTVTGSASHGIRLDDPSDYNTLNENTLANNNGYGFWMWYSSHNLFYHNLCNNTKNVLVLSAPAQGYNSTNTWDNGYPAGGNYWSDYKGQDIYSGPYQNETGSDGIADAPYYISSDNEDNYPLMGIYYDFAVFLPPYPTGGIEHVNMISNSTVSDLHYLSWLDPPNQYLQQGQLLIQFSAFEKNGTAGFCRLMIPKTVLNASSYIVLVDWRPVNTVELTTPNSTEVYLYFTYVRSDHEIIVTIPEFPLMIALPIVIMVTSLSVRTFRRKRVNHLLHENKI